MVFGGFTAYVRFVQRDIGSVRDSPRRPASLSLSPSFDNFRITSSVFLFHW